MHSMTSFDKYIPITTTTIKIQHISITLKKFPYTLKQSASHHHTTAGPRQPLLYFFLSLYIIFDCWRIAYKWNRMYFNIFWLAEIKP